MLEKERARLDIRKNSFTVRVVRKWNELPESVKNQKSVNGFKNAYDRWKKNQPIEIAPNNPSTNAGDTEER